MNKRTEIAILDLLERVAASVDAISAAVRVNTGHAGEALATLREIRHDLHERDLRLGMIDFSRRQGERVAREAFAGVETSEPIPPPLVDEKVRPLRPKLKALEELALERLTTETLELLDFLEGLQADEVSVGKDWSIVIHVGPVKDRSLRTLRAIGALRRYLKVVE